MGLPTDLVRRGGGGMPGWATAGAWGLFGGAALVVGAAVAWLVRVPGAVIASVMAFGSGVLISAVAFDLMQEAADRGGLLPAAVGFLGGAAAYRRPTPRSPATARSTASGPAVRAA